MQEKSVRISKVEERARLIYKIIFEGLAFATIDKLKEVVKMLGIICLTLLICNTAFAGTASFYGNGEKLNKHTASGEVFNPNDFTCATYEYDFGTMLRVTNLDNDKSVVVRVNDRGPNKRLGREIDLSRRAFEEISELRRGLIEVTVEAL